MSQRPDLQAVTGAVRRPWVRPPAEKPPKPNAIRAEKGSAIVMILALALVVTYMGRPFDYVLTGLHLPTILSAVALLASLLAGGLGVLRSRIGLPLVAFVAWMALVTPFSSWKGGSAGFVARFAFTTFAFLLPVAAAPRSLRDVRLLLIVAAVAPTLMLLASIDSGNPADALPGEEGGRLALAGGTYANSGDMAFAAGFTIPFWFYVCSQFSLPMLRIPVALLAVVYLIRTALLSGTRSVLVGGAGMLAVYFFATRASRRLLLPVAAGIALITVPLLLPGQVTDRLKTLFGAFYTVDADVSLESTQSTAQRRQLLLDSLRFTATHPITGVGPGQFVDVRWQEGVEAGTPRGWLVTHNTYTQVSSETGVPGLIFFLAVGIGIVRTLRSVKKLNIPGSHPDWRMVKSMRTCVLASFVFYAVCAFFLSMLGYMHAILVAALAVALERTTRAAVDRAAAAGQGTDGEAAPSASVPAGRRFERLHTPYAAGNGLRLQR